MRDFILNDKSLSPSAYGNAQELAVTLADISRGTAKLVHSGFSHPRIRAKNIYTIAAAADGSTIDDAIVKLIRSPRTKEEGVFLRTLIMKGPFDSDLRELELDQFRSLDSDPAHPLSCEALILCIACDGIALSLPTSEALKENTLRVPYDQIDLDGEIRRHEEKVDNLSREEHSSDIISRSRAIGMDTLTQSDFWKEKERILPNLAFGLDVQANIQGLQTEFYRPILKKLFHLNEVVTKWQEEGTTNPTYGLAVSDESESTKQRTPNSRKFRNPVGEKVDYWWHVKHSTYRIHFRLISDTKSIEIGYIGKHIPTAKYPT